jgi:hypothetical protein
VEIPAATRPPRRRALIVGAAIALVVLAIVLATMRREESPPPSLSPASIVAAVVPAEVEADAEWSWLRLGVMDVVATRMRSSGVPTVPSENIIALLNVPANQRSANLRDAAGFRLLIAPRASRDGSGWRVHLDADDGAGQHRVAEAAASDPAEAARLAADRLLVTLGRKAPLVDRDAEPYAELVRRVDAAVLADDPATARTLIERAPVAAQQSIDLRVRLAKIDFRGGRLDAARERLVALLDEASAQSAPVQRAAILDGLGAVALRRDDPQQAERYFAEAVELLATRAEPALLGEAYLGRAGAAKEQGHYDAASADYSRARIALEQANDTLALLRVAANEGFLDLDQQRPAQACPQFATAGKGFEQWGALNEAIYMHIGEVGCALALLEPVKALETADMALPLAARIDNQDTRDSLAIARAKALLANGHLREARATLEPLLVSKDASTAAVARVPMAQLESDAGNFDASAKHAAAAVAALVQPAYAQVRAQAWWLEAHALAHASDAGALAEAITAFATWAASSDKPRAVLLAQLARAEQAWRFGNASAWRAEFEKARTLAQVHSVPADIALVAAVHADALIAAGDLEAAAVEVGRVSRWAERDFASAVLEARLYAALGRDEARQAALARAKGLAGERSIPADANRAAVTTR